MGGVSTRRRVLFGATCIAAVAAAASACAQPFPVPPAPTPLAGPPIPPPPLRHDQIDLIVKTLQDAETHGFRQGEFLPANLLTLMASKDPADRRAGDALLRATIARYARAQHGLRITAWPKNWALRPPPYDAEADFNFAVAQDKLASWIDTLPPPFDRYRVLRTALARYQAIVDQGGWPTIEEGPALKQGSNGDRVVALRKRLMAEDPSLNLDLASPDFDQSVEDAVKFYQRRNGFDTTGVLGPQALEAINIPAASRVLQIEANMERWRWAPRLWPATRIEVNIAAAEMTYWVENAIAEEMRAAPGRPDDQTPMLTSAIESVVLNPPWNLPAGIAEKEYYPKERAHPGYLESHGFRVITNPDGSTRLQQKSGPKSALGQIKFDFPQPLRRLPARHALAQGVRPGLARGQPRLRAAGAAAGPGRQTVRGRRDLDPRSHPRSDCRWQDGAHSADPGRASLPALFHRLSGREGADGFPQRHLRLGQSAPAPDRRSALMPAGVC